MLRWEIGGGTLTPEKWQERKPKLPNESTVEGTERRECSNLVKADHFRSMNGSSLRRAIDLGRAASPKRRAILPRKEVIQPHLPVRLPCYDFVLIASSTFDGCLLAVSTPASGVSDFHDVTGGVYKAREHIHRRVLTGGY